jgi:hypothetical protein
VRSVRGFGNHKGNAHRSSTGIQSMSTVAMEAIEIVKSLGEGAGRVLAGTGTSEQKRWETAAPGRVESSSREQAHDWTACGGARRRLSRPRFRRQGFFHSSNSMPVCLLSA